MDKNNITIEDIGKKLNFETSLFFKNKLVQKRKLTPYQKYIIQDTLSSFDADAVYLIGESPVIFFKKISSFDNETIKKLHHLVWCQSKVPLLFIITPTEVRIYDCTKKPIYLHDDFFAVNEIELYNSSNDRDFAILEKKFNNFSLESGQFLSELAIYNSRSTNRVDKLLVENLNHFRNKYKKKLGISIIHDLLCRSIIILYLEDREAIDQKFYNRYLSNAQKYLDVLENRTATFKLFEDLNKQFNGDLFPVSEKEKELIENKHLTHLKDCFNGVDFKKGQNPIWRLFNFKFIPIELISEIYQQFLIEEDKDRYGSYYTPIPLVDFMLNEILPFPDENDCNYKLKILDPACGSGIFLVKAYQRLVERYKYCGKNRDGNNDINISFEELCKILNDNIFGIDLNEEAIKITSLSLCLSVLNYLEPKSIWQNEKKRFPFLINSKKKSKYTQGNNLFVDNALKPEIFAESNFDIVIGNPPWKRGDLDFEIKEILNEKGFAQEYSQAFVIKSTFFAPQGKIALVVTSKNLFNNSSHYLKFRKYLFNENFVSLICNFSLIGEQWFEGATCYPCVIFYQQSVPEIVNDTLPYFTPKPSELSKVIDGIIIEKSDIKYLQREECTKPNTKIWKIGMWGTFRDFDFISKLEKHSKLSEFIKSNQWGSGLHKKYKGDKILDSKYEKLPLLNNIDKYYSNINSQEKLGPPYKFYRKFNKLFFKSPLIIITEGLHKEQSKESYKVGLCSSYIDFDCLYKSFGIFGISDLSIMKSLVGYLNSSFVSYYLFLTSSSWGIDRQRNIIEDILFLPAFPFLWNKKIIKKLENEVNKIIKLKKVEFDKKVKKSSDLTKSETTIDNIIFNELNMNKFEKYLVENVLENSISFYHKGTSSNACKPVSYDDLKNYSAIICKMLNNILMSVNSSVCASVYNNGIRANFNVVVFHYNKKCESNSIKNVVNNEDFQKVLSFIKKFQFQQHGENIYSRKEIKYYDESSIYIMKPNEKRFWSKAIALQDGDEIIQESLNTEHTTN